MYGIELHKGDNICFTLSMRKDQKPMVKAKVIDFAYGKSEDAMDFILVEYIESQDVAWGRLEKKLPQKVSSHRVIKCY